jgi:hypothetical protein
LRSLYAVLLGLGGWFAGVLIALTALPTVALDDEVLALVSIGLPIALGIYWASARATIARLAATVVGTVIGAWLGFNVSSGLFAVLLTIVGATAGANLIVLVLDIRRDRAAREAAAVATPRAVTEASA